VPISKYYALEKKTLDDFDIKQVTVVALPPVPVLDIVRKPGLGKSGSVKNGEQTKPSEKKENTVSPKPTNIAPMPEVKPQTLQPTNLNGTAEKAPETKSVAPETKNEASTGSRKQQHNDNPGCACLIL